MTYTERVMKEAETAPATKNLTEEEYEKLAHARWLRMLTESAELVSRSPAPVRYLPSELSLLGELLPPQPLVSPIKGWIDGLSPPVKKEGRTIELSLPGVSGLSDGLCWQRVVMQRGKNVPGWTALIRPSWVLRGS